MRFEIPTKKIKKSISDEKVQNIGIQLPEGLKRYGKKILKELKTEFKDKKFIFSGYPCYGACDIRDTEFSNLKIDKLIHLGHFEIPFSKDIEVDFFPIKSTLKIEDVVKKSLNHLDGKRIGVFTTPQYHHKLEKILEILKKHDFSPKIGKGASRVTEPGIVLGCDFTAIKSLGDELLYVGSGDFHPLGAALSNKTNVIAADPETNSIKKIGYEELLKKRIRVIAKIKDLNDFGIIISSKKGQMRVNEAEKLFDLIKNSSKNVDLIAMDDIQPDKLMNLDYEVYVNTACPRISIDDYNKFKEPIVAPIEIEIAFGKKEYNDYKLDEF